MTLADGGVMDDVCRVSQRSHGSATKRALARVPPLPPPDNPGVRGTYDRHRYEAEKRDALEKLAILVERILNPPSKTVVALRSAR